MIEHERTKVASFVKSNISSLYLKDASVAAT